MSTLAIDTAALAELRVAAKAEPERALREVARQFESIFTRMLLQSMRNASLGEGLGESEETEFYQDMFDQQLSLELAKGDGVGLAGRLVEQLKRADAAGSTRTDLDKQAFVDELRPLAEPIANSLGVAVESVIAHAALESGWGAHRPRIGSGADSFNLFGIKAAGQWHGEHAMAATSEVVDGESTTMNQDFRAYDSLSGGLRDYGRLLRESPRYAAALGTGNDTHAFASALKRAGYATDPDYVAKLVATAHSVRALQGTAPYSPTASQPITVSHHG